MDSASFPRTRVSDPYSVDNISSPPAHRHSANAPSSPLSRRSNNPTSNAKRQRAPSEAADHPRKRRQVPSSPGVRAQINAKTNVAGKAPTSRPAPLASTSNRDSGFHETEEVEAQNKLTSVSASRDGDSGFHDAFFSVESGALSSMGSDEGHAATQTSPSRGRDTIIAIRRELGASRSDQAFETEDDYHDAMDQQRIDDPFVRDTDTIYAASDASMVVSSRQDTLPQPSIVVSGASNDEEQAITVQPTSSEIAQAKGSGKNRVYDKTPRRRTPVDRRRKTPDTAQQSIVVSGQSHDEDQAIHAKSRTAPKSEAHADRDNDDVYTVSRISAHRTVDGSDEIELLVHWEDSPDGNAPTWELEENLQENALDAAVDYWGTVEGGRLAVRPYEVYAITGHEWLKKGKTKRKSLFLEVEWLGYKEKSMEPVRRLSQDQPELVEEYFQSIGGRPQVR